MILFLDGGYTQTAGNEACAELIQECTQKEALVSVKIEENMDWNRVFRDLEDADAIVLAADVYLDSVPSFVLRFLEKVEQAVIGGESIGGRFYAVLYTELYEGEQTSVAMEVLKNFCVHANITWGRGLGIGGNKIETSAQGQFLGQTSQKYVRFQDSVLAGARAFYQGKNTGNRCVYQAGRSVKKGVYSQN